jgi:hypothetical protein
VSSDDVSFRLVRSDNVPATNPHQLAYKFGLQDKQGDIMEGRRLPSGMLVFDFTLKVKEGKDGRPVFTGPYASGPVDDRFVYLSWFGGGSYINRFKARLSAVDWTLIQASRKQGKAITADVSGRGPREAGRPIAWFLE